MTAIQSKVFALSVPWLSKVDMQAKGFPLAGLLSNVMVRTNKKGTSCGNALWVRSAKYLADCASVDQPFGSIPCLRNSSRASSLSQLPRLIPFLSAASLSCWRSSGGIRSWKVGDQPSPLGDLSRLIVDTYVRNLLVWFLLRTYVNTTNVEKTTPRTVGAVPGRLPVFIRW